MTPTPGQPEKPDLLDEELARLEEFVALLKEEQALLAAGDGDRLLALVESKTALANRLAALGEMREAALDRQGLGTGRAGMEAWLAKQGSPARQTAWQKFLALAAEARELNELNGKLIGLHMRHNQQALAALMSATDRAMVYGPDGQQSAGLSGRILGKA